MEIQVTGIARDGQSIDQTRNGIARGTVVVPEFSVGAAAATTILGITLSIILLQRFSTRVPRLGF
jgi:hypothetical protein